MPTDSPSSSPKERVATLVYFGSLYFVTVGVLYLWGYWSPFRINILEYLGLTDILKSTAYPIATALVFTMVGATLGEAFADSSAPPDSGTLRARIWAHVAASKNGIVLGYIAVTTSLLVLGPIGKWHALPVLLALPLYVIARQHGVLVGVVRDEQLRSVVIFVAAVLPFLAYGRGTLTADDIRSGASFAYLTSEVPGYTHGPDAQPAQRLRMVGHAGEQFFLFDPASASVVLFKPESGKPIVIRSYAGGATASLVATDVPAATRTAPTASTP